MKYTYLIKGKNGYKIGQSINPENRLKQLKTADPSVVLLSYGNGITEKQLHNIYKNKRTALEWFKLKRRDVEDIMRLLKNEYIPNSNNGEKYKTFVINFGKYKNTLITDMLDNNQTQYMRWYIKNCNHKYTKKVFRWWLNRKNLIQYN